MMPDHASAMPVEHAKLYELLVSELHDFVVVLLNGKDDTPAGTRESKSILAIPRKSLSASRVH